MLENIDQLIETNLKLIAEANNQEIFLGTFQGLGSSFRTEQLKFAEILEGRGLISIEPNKRERCDLTPFGYSIYKAGGWLKYLEAETRQQEEINNRKEKKEKNEYLLSKWKRVVFWPIFIIAFFSGIYSIYDIISKFNKPETLIEETITKEDLEKELLNLKKEMLIEFQKQNSQNNKLQNDSLK